MSKRIFNRIKVVLAEKDMTNRELAELLGKTRPPFRAGAPTICNLRPKRFMRSRGCWTWIYATSW